MTTTKIIKALYLKMSRLSFGKCQLYLPFDPMLVQSQDCKATFFFLYFKGIRWASQQGICPHSQNPLEMTIRAKANLYINYLTGQCLYDLVVISLNENLIVAMHPPPLKTFNENYLTLMRIVERSRSGEKQRKEGSSERGREGFREETPVKGGRRRQTKLLIIICSNGN
jgi:hypothetical protein